MEYKVIWETVYSSILDKGFEIVRANSESQAVSKALMQAKCRKFPDKRMDFLRVTEITVHHE